VAPAVSALIVLLAAPPTTDGTGPPAADAAQGAAAPEARRPATQAETAKLMEDARAQFEAGNQHYAAGRFHDAIRHFQAGYALVPRPNFLVNLGQSYRKLGDLPRAKEAYVAYVRALPENSALRDQALQVLAEIEVQLQEQKGATGPSIGAEPPSVLDPKTAPVPPLPPTADTGLQRGTVLALSLAGAGVALGGTGLFFQLRAKSASDELSRLNRNGGMFDPELQKRGRRDQRLGIGFMAAGGTAAAAALILYVVMDGDEPAHAGVAVGPSGLGVGVRF
jgi:tetratricopeptide (TPR) repeat protein